MAALVLTILTLALIAYSYVLAYIAAATALLFLVLQSGAGSAGPIAAGIWVLACLYVWKQQP